MQFTVAEALEHYQRWPHPRGVHPAELGQASEGLASTEEGPWASVWPALRGSFKSRFGARDRESIDRLMWDLYHFGPELGHPYRWQFWCQPERPSTTTGEIYADRSRVHWYSERLYSRDYDAYSDGVIWDSDEGQERRAKNRQEVWRRLYNLGKLDKEKEDCIPAQEWDWLHACPLGASEVPF